MLSNICSDKIEIGNYLFYISNVFNNNKTLSDAIFGVICL